MDTAFVSLIRRQRRPASASYAGL